MHLAVLLATAKSSKSSSLPMLILLAVFVAVYFLWLRPKSKKMKAQQGQSKTYAVGDEVMTIGGLIGTVVEINGDRVTVRSGGAVGAEHVYLAQAIKGQAPAPKDNPVPAPSATDVGIAAPVMDEPSQQDADDEDQTK